MIHLKHLIENPELYTAEMVKRGRKPETIQTLVETTHTLRTEQQNLDALRAQKNEFNTKILTLLPEEKESAIEAMKVISSKINLQETTVNELKARVDELLAHIPNLSSEKTPVGKTDQDNIVIQRKGTQPEFDFDPVPYYELAVYKEYVDQVTGTKNMGARGYYLKGQIARFQKVLFDWAEEIILKHGFEYMYVPLMLNTTTLTGTGHYPDFDGQMYEVKINEKTNYYLIGSSEPSMISYYADKNLETLPTPIKMMANTTCFRQEAGSYGKDQQGILRVHQFEKIEMNAICTPEDNDRIFALHGAINEEILSALDLYFRVVEVCSGDMPTKHYRQTDYEVYFPGTKNFREVASNGSASDYQNRTLGISYINKGGEKSVPWGLNCTGITFRTGLAILEQFQTKDGRVKLPKVIADRMGVEYL